jgi:serine/threonine-protein kinase
VEELDPTAGAVVGGRYRLDARIGEGAFGQVFRATDLKDGAGVALKVLSAESIDTAGVDRFRREAQLATQLRHPNTIRLIAFNLRTKPWPFIVYELLEGETLEQLMRREGPLSEARAASIAMQVLHSLMEAHELGIVHRDIKPSNVFVCATEGKLGGVKVLDFGIAKSVDGIEAQVTAAGILVGTPRYMPPEQIKGETPIPAMDLYATGVMLAEMLSGEPALTCSAAEACLEQLRPERLPLPAVLTTSRLWPVIARATEKDLERRHSTVNGMLGDLERVLGSLGTTPLAERRRHPEPARGSLSETSVMERPTETLPPAAPTGSSGAGRWIAALAVLFLLALAGTGATLWWLRTRGGL